MYFENKRIHVKEEDLENSDNNQNENEALNQSNSNHSAQEDLENSDNNQNENEALNQSNSNDSAQNTDTESGESIQAQIVNSTYNEQISEAEILITQIALWINNPTGNNKEEEEKRKKEEKINARFFEIVKAQVSKLKSSAEETDQKIKKIREKIAENNAKYDEFEEKRQRLQDMEALARDDPDHKLFISNSLVTMQNTMFNVSQTVQNDEDMIYSLELLKSDTKYYLEFIDMLIVRFNNALSFKLYKINLGGRLFETTHGTLCRFPDSDLAKIFTHPFEPSEIPFLKLQNDTFYFDRSPKHFSWILEFLRNPKDFDIADMTIAPHCLYLEARYFGLHQLINQLGYKKTTISLLDAKIIEPNLLYVLDQMPEGIFHHLGTRFGTKDWSVDSLRSLTTYPTGCNDYAFSPKDTIRFQTNLELNNSQKIKLNEHNVKVCGIAFRYNCSHSPGVHRGYPVKFSMENRDKLGITVSYYLAQPDKPLITEHLKNSRKFIYLGCRVDPPLSSQYCTFSIPEKRWGDFELFGTISHTKASVVNI